MVTSSDVHLLLPRVGEPSPLIDQAEIIEGNRAVIEASIARPPSPESPGSTIGMDSLNLNDGSNELNTAECPPIDGAYTSWWYTDESGELQGPVWGDDLLEMISRGEISGQSWVFEQGTEDWISIAQAERRIRGECIAKETFIDVE